MNLKLLYTISIVFLMNTVQADLIRAPNDKINAMVSPNDPEKSVASTGWHYTIKNNTKQDILGFMRLEAKGGVQAPLDIKAGQTIDLYTLRGKDYEFNPDVLGKEVSITKEGAIAAAVVPAAIAISAQAAAGLAAAAASSAATAAATNTAFITGLAQQAINTGVVTSAEAGAAILNATAGEIAATSAATSAAAGAGTAAVVGGVTVAAAAVAAAIMGGVWGAEVDPTHITVFWNETPNRARKYTFVLNASSNVGAILAGNHELEFYIPNRNNELRLKIDGTPLPAANILQDKEIV